MQYIDNIIFLIALIAGFGLFLKSIKKFTVTSNSEEPSTEQISRPKDGKPWGRSRSDRAK